MKTALYQMACELDNLPEKEKMIWLIRNFHRYLEMEKEQIIMSYREGGYNESPFIDSKEAEDYYNETYNQHN